MADQQEAYELDAPPVGVLISIAITTQIEPLDAWCLITGRDSDGREKFVKIEGGTRDTDLPFAHPSVTLQKSRNMQKFFMATRGFKLQR